MGIEELITERLATEIQESIDWEITVGLYEGMGWTRLEIKYTPEQKWMDVINWAYNNFSGKYKEHSGTWVIEHSEDATMLLLKFK